MKILTVWLTFLLLSPLALAQSIGGGIGNVGNQPTSNEPIEMLDLGACWIQKVKASPETDSPLLGYKIASFGGGQAFMLFAEASLNTWIQTQLKTKFQTLDALSYEVALHCYSAGYHIGIQVQQPDQQPICLQAKSKSGAINDLELIAIRPGPAFLSGEYCSGIEERTLGLSLKVTGEATVDNIRTKISEQPYLSRMVEKIEYQPGSFFALARLKPEFAFHEVDVRIALATAPELYPLVSNVWLNTMNMIQGESRMLFRGATEPFIFRP
jgi:hypothetical protein